MHISGYTKGRGCGERDVGVFSDFCVCSFYAQKRSTERFAEERGWQGSEAECIRMFVESFIYVLGG